ncbi:MAG: hypothetical protein RAK25_02820, partial [TACK group archaeon]|nr:hypothetical protein [TACK group archaeon]
VSWPSTATLEAFGIASLDVAVLVLILKRKTRLPLGFLGLSPWREGLEREDTLSLFLTCESR